MSFVHIFSSYPFSRRPVLSHGPSEIAPLILTEKKEAVKQKPFTFLCGRKRTNWSNFPRNKKTAAQPVTGHVPSFLCRHSSASEHFSSHLSEIPSPGLLFFQIIPVRKISFRGFVSRKNPRWTNRLKAPKALMVFLPSVRRDSGTSLWV